LPRVRFFFAAQADDSHGDTALLIHFPQVINRIFRISPPFWRINLLYNLLSIDYYLNVRPHVRSIYSDFACNQSSTIKEKKVDSKRDAFGIKSRLDFSLQRSCSRMKEGPKALLIKHWGKTTAWFR
jgi:hypothetical protein